MNTLRLSPLFVALVVSLSVADEEPLPLKSGPQLGSAAAPYHPLLATGKTIGQRWCMVCTHRARGNAMVIVFARYGGAVTEELAKAVEAATAKHKKVGGIVTFLTTEGQTAKQAEALTGAKVRFLNDGEEQQFATLQTLAKTLGINNSSLNVYTADGPASYGLSPDAAVTVLVADSSATVRANVALRKSEFTSARVKEIATIINKTLSSF